MFIWIKNLFYTNKKRFHWKHYYRPESERLPSDLEHPDPSRYYTTIKYGEFTPKGEGFIEAVDIYDAQAMLKRKLKVPNYELESPRKLIMFSAFTNAESKVIRLDEVVVKEVSNSPVKLLK